MKTNKGIRVLTLLLAIGVSGYALNYLNFEIKGVLNLKDAIVNNVLYRTVFYLHIISGSIALSTGAFQFIPKLRSGTAHWHKRLGKIYAYSAIISSSGGLIIAFYASGGWIAKSGFATFSAYWLITTILGINNIRKNNIQDHLNWMHRSYAAAFAAVTLRVWLLLFPIFNLDFFTAYKIASWMSWVVNIAIVEIILYRRKGSIASPGIATSQ